MKRTIPIAIICLFALVAGSCGKEQPADPYPDRDGYINFGLPSATLWKTVNEPEYATFEEAVQTYGSEIPTKEQWDELIEYCSWEWNGSGFIISRNNKSITLPADGYIAHELRLYGTNCCYWSSTEYDENNAFSLSAYEGDWGLYPDSRNSGNSVRLIAN